ncbi:beta-1,3-galactosyltransferase 1-like [Ruditapes philippinarum]|uniref:beta-1,3-galactosyltransferase 1-like n=1 Tax=Ruditapes philippinarum TaxID=129788 RepID=UPI00295BDF77|nr:beta-1,3-galactosyltransferase 1-like [Ruditapes philippinarum]
MPIGSKHHFVIILIIGTLVTSFIGMTRLGYSLSTFLKLSRKHNNSIDSALGIQKKVNGSEQLRKKLKQLKKYNTIVNDRLTYKTRNNSTKNQNTKKTDKIRETVCDKCFTHDFKYLINNEKICKLSNNNTDKIDLFILIFTEHKNFEQRDVIRRTWLSYSRNNTGNIRYAFLLGKPTSDDLHEQVIQENNVYHDIIKEDFVDTYMNLTYKTIMGFKWVVTFCSSAKYVLKTDDDMYINVPNFVHYINTSGAELENHVVGLCITLPSPMRNRSSKWYVSIESYKERRYPGYCSGTGYLTSFNIVNKIFAISSKIPFFYFEDVYVGLCLRKIGGFIKNIKGFNKGRVKLDKCVYNGKTMFTSHHLTAKQIETVWNCTIQNIK